MILDTPSELTFGTYPWYAPTIEMPGLVKYMSKTLGLHHDLVRDAVAYEVFRVICESNSFMKVYPPIMREHQFVAEVVDRQWLNGTGLYGAFSEFIEALRDDIEALRRHLPGSIGLYTDVAHIRRCSARGAYFFPVVDERHIQDVRARPVAKDATDQELVKAGCVYSQGGAMILPEMAGELLLKPWQCGEDIFIHRLPASMVRFLRSV